MATAQMITIPPKPAPLLTRIELTLTAEEAQTLADLFMHVGGPPIESRRGLIEGIRRALEALYIHGRSTLQIDDIEPGKGVCFKARK